jgi:diazepam-binding inhibitor (GABA receptor modulating acyl-CoA-binding protein)
MSSSELKECFKRALEFVRPYLQMSSAELASAAGPAAALALGDADKLRFYGYFKQATKGDQPLGLPLPADDVERAKLEAWSTVRGVSRKDAMRAFVFLLDRALATWDAGNAMPPAPTPLTAGGSSSVVTPSITSSGSLGAAPGAPGASAVATK